MDNHRLALEEFVERARKIHGEKYDYSKTEYNGFNNKLRIVCREHGEFWQSPYKHLTGERGYPTCASSHQERKLSLALLENGIKFTREKTFEGLKGVERGLLRYDFFIDEINLLIEIDGRQYSKICQMPSSYGSPEKTLR